MATRFYFASTGSPIVSPAFDAGWEQTAQAVRRQLQRKSTLSATTALTNSTAITVPITTTQDMLCAQFVSDPLPPTRMMVGTFSTVQRALESATTANVTLAVVVKAHPADGGASLGTLYSTFNIDTEFGTTAATRIVSAQATTALTINTTWRLVVEIGGHAAAPTASGSYTLRFGTAAASDFALTSGLTTDLNTWCETSQDLAKEDLNNFMFASANGLSVSI